MAFAPPRLKNGRNHEKVQFCSIFIVLITTGNQTRNHGGATWKFLPQSFQNYV